MKDDIKTYLQIAAGALAVIFLAGSIYDQWRLRKLNKAFEGMIASPPMGK